MLRRLVQQVGSVFQAHRALYASAAFVCVVSAVSAFGCYLHYSRMIEAGLQGLALRGGPAIYTAPRRLVVGQTVSAGQLGQYLRLAGYGDNAGDGERDQAYHDVLATSRLAVGGTAAHFMDLKPCTSRVGTEGTCQGCGGPSAHVAGEWILFSGSKSGGHPSGGAGRAGGHGGDQAERRTLPQIHRTLPQTESRARQITVMWSPQPCVAMRDSP